MALQSLLAIRFKSALSEINNNWGEKCGSFGFVLHVNMNCSCISLAFRELRVSFPRSEIITETLALKTYHTEEFHHQKWHHSFSKPASNYRGKFLFEFSQVQSSFPSSYQPCELFSAPHTNHLAFSYKLGLVTIQRFYGCAAKAAVCPGVCRQGSCGRAVVPVDDARRVLAGAAVVEVLPSVVEVTPGTDSSWWDVGLHTQ